MGRDRMALVQQRVEAGASADLFRTETGRGFMRRLKAIAGGRATSDRERLFRLGHATGQLESADMHRPYLAPDECVTLSHLAHMWEATGGVTFADQDLDIPRGNAPAMTVAPQPMFSGTGCALA